VTETVPASTVPPDDNKRDLVVAHPDNPTLTHLGVVGDTYTFLVTGEQTNGRYALIDMLIPPDGGPPPHRHDFEEMFHILEGEIDVVFRGESSTARAGDTVNVPANAPHSFHNNSGVPVRLLCMVTPAGLEDYFTQFGEPLASRTTPATPADAPSMPERMAKAMALAPSYRIENLFP
jgi:mannose-6-phosphate isomerase-like protein (cupin superfamily)